LPGDQLSFGVRASCICVGTFDVLFNSGAWIKYIKVVMTSPISPQTNPEVLATVLDPTTYGINMPIENNIKSVTITKTSWETYTIYIVEVYIFYVVLGEYFKSIVWG